MALVLMQFKIGPDMGWVMAKAIVLSLIWCTQPSARAYGQQLPAD